MKEKILSFLGLDSSKLVDSIGSTIDRFVTTTKEKEELKIELQKEVNRHFEDNKKLDLEELKQYISDTDSARKRDIESNNSPNSSWLSRNIAPILAIAWTMAAIAIILLSFFGIINSDKGIESQIITGVFGIVMLILGYYFGSSASSQKKNDTLYNLTKNINS